MTVPSPATAARRPPYTVVVADRIDEHGFALLRAVPEFEVISTAGQPGSLPQALQRAHALVVRSDTKVTEQLMAGAPRLVVIGRAGIGVDNIDVSAATRRGIAVLNAPGGNTVSAAEHTLALLLALVRRVPAAAESMRRGEWDRKRFAGTELRGKTLGAVGLGRIGAHVATVARALGMAVLAHDPYLPAPRARELGVELAPLDDLLRRADVVTLHVPLTDETRCLIDAGRLAMMKPTAFLVNAARGELVDADALVAALDAGRLAGAALDVFDPEPLPPDSPLRRCGGVILTPHLAASTTEAQERVAQEICAAVRDGLLSGLMGGAVNLPGVSREAFGRLRWVLDLARRCGRLASAIARGRVQAITVAYGGADEAAPRPVMLAAVEGTLTAMGVGPVSLVNATVLAQERGISVERRVGDPVSGFATTVGVTLTTGDRQVTVEGAVLGERVGRIIRIDEFLVDVPADQHVLVLRNRDVPGVIGRVGTALGSANINIGSYHQSRLEPPGTEALAAIVVDQPPPADVLAALEQLPDVLEVRLADLNGSA
jgi:D-3-phosphoglycerate dehydrogenase